MKGLLREILRGEDGYIDAGTGIIIMQLLIAGFVSGLVMVKVYWGKIVGRVKSLKNRKGREREG